MADQTITVGSGGDVATIALINPAVTASTGDVLTVEFLDNGAGGHSWSAGYQCPAGPDSIIYKPAAGGEHLGVVGSQPNYRILWTGGVVSDPWRSTRGNVTMQDLEFDYGGAMPTGWDGVISAIGASADLICNRVIVHSVQGANTLHAFVAKDGGLLTCNRCIATDLTLTGGGATYLQAYTNTGTASTVKCYNCIGYNLEITSGSSTNSKCTSFAPGSSGTIECYNCAGAAVVNNSTGTGAGEVFHVNSQVVDYCASDDTSATDATNADVNCISGLSLANMFEDAAAGKFRPRTSLIDEGNDYSVASPGSGTDIAGDTVTGTWDIGVFEGTGSDFYDTFTGTADTPIYDRDPDVGPRWLRS